MADRHVEGENQFEDEDDEGWKYEFDPLDPAEGVYKGIELDILLCIDSRKVVGMSLAEIIECLTQYEIPEITETLQELIKNKTLNQFKGKRYFIGVL